MKNSWRHFFRRLAAGCIVSGAMAFASAMCYAVQLAHDTAADPVYNDGWLEGDNGGTGFEPWNFDTDFLPPGGEAQHRMDGPIPPTTEPPASEFNQIGRSWTLMNFAAYQGDVARAGRGFEPLDVGQTIRVVIDNPTERFTYRGYFVRFNSRNGEGGGGNICYGSSACTPGASPTPKAGFNIFKGFGPPINDGRWGFDAQTGGGHTPLYDIDTHAGVQLDLEITGPDAYKATMTPLDNPARAFTTSGTLRTPGEPVDWLEFTFFNTATDEAFDTDFFIRSIEIIGPDAPGVPGDYNDDGTVDAADYVLWRKGGPLQNEVVTPGMVTPEDYTAWRTRFGNTSGAGAGASLVAGSVPEPDTCVYIVGAALAGAAFLARRS